MSTVIDSPQRKLSGRERDEQQRLWPALQAWTQYLSRVGAWSRFDDAEANRAPIVARHRGDPLYPPLIVSPAYALEWARAAGQAGLPGTGVALSFDAVVGALDFMHAAPVTTFRPAVDPGVGTRRRQGYYELTSELTARLRQGNYTPSLAPPRGRPRTGRALGVSGRLRVRPVLTDDEGLTLRIVRHFLSTTEPTVLLATAVEQGRPLATRPPGRPARTSAGGALIRTRVVVAHTDALVAHVAEHAGGLGVRPLSTEEVRAMLGSYHRSNAANAVIVAPVSQFSCLDGGQRRKVSGWWRFDLPGLGLRELVAGELLGEAEHWRRAQQREEFRPPPPSAAVVVAAAVAAADRSSMITGRGSVPDLPPGVEPEWLKDPEYRDSLGLPPLDE